MLPFSVLITTYNEEDNIRACIESVRWAEEIIIVDSFSSDHTLSIAQSFPQTKIFQREYTGPADQKNWAIPQAKFPWVLILDADERADTILKESISEIIPSNTTQDAFTISRINYFLGKRVQYSGWQNEKVTRLIRRDKCRYNSLQVHEDIEKSGLNIGHIQGGLHHYTYKSMGHFLEKMDRYAKWSAQDYLHKTKSIGWFHLFIKPFFRFFQHFVLKLGFLDGKVGFVISCIMAWGVFCRYLYMIDLKNSKKNDF